MSPTLPSNHLPFPATHIADARRRRSPRHHYSSSSSLQSALTTQYTAELLTTTSEAPFPWLAVAPQASLPYRISGWPQNPPHRSVLRARRGDGTALFCKPRPPRTHTRGGPNAQKNMASPVPISIRERMAGDDVTISPALVAALCALCSADCGRQGRQGKPGGQSRSIFPM